MKIEIESEYVTMKMTAIEADTLHCIFFKLINDLKAKQEWDPAWDSDQETMLAMLRAFDERIYDAFYKYQQN